MAMRPQKLFVLTESKAFVHIGPGFGYIPSKRDALKTDSKVAIVIRNTLIPEEVSS
jgi:hypothetical protein